jgi:conflict system pore-forming effector with SLATT domain
MTKDDDFRRLYVDRRFEHQRSYYQRAHSELKRAKDQLVNLSALLLAISAFLGVLAGFDVKGKGVILALIAIVPAIATAFAAYDGLYAFDRHTKLYGDALNSLDQVGGSGAGAIGAYVEQVEGVLRNEQAQWGQLEAELGGS